MTLVQDSTGELVALVIYHAQDLNTSYTGPPAVVELILVSHHNSFKKIGRQNFKEVDDFLDWNLAK